MPHVLLLVLAMLQAPTTPPAPAPQNPSPMTDTTRPHPRVAAYVPAGRRLAIGQGTLFIPDRVKPSSHLTLIVHFHGEPWLVEHQITKWKRNVVLVTFQLGSGSGVYARAFAEPAQFAAVLADAAAGASKLLGKPVTFGPVVLSSFSAGYGAVRAILRQPEHYARVSSVVLSDSMHASYVETGAAAPRVDDLPVEPIDVDAFMKLAADAAAGRKQFVILHSEVFPGTYASTTETADAILKQMGLKNRPKLRTGPIGMQQLSEVKRGRLALIGYAGNSAPDHLDQLYALGDQLKRWKVVRR